LFDLPDEQEDFFFAEEVDAEGDGGLEGKFALVVQALRYLGKAGVGAREIETLRRTLLPAEKRRLVKNTGFVVDWIYEVAKKIAEKTA
jgi:hypothetical protein